MFDSFQNADKVLEDLLFVTRRRGDFSEQVNDDVQDFIKKYKLKNEATSNVKIQQVLCSFGLNDVGIYLREGTFSSNIGIVNLHPSKGTHWVCYINEKHFESFGCVPPRKFFKFIIKRNGYCLYSEYQIQNDDSFCASYRL